MNPESPLSQSRRALWSIRLIAALCCLGSAYIAIRYADQRPLDQYSFRQTQTALTTYWLKLNGFAFAYETPVMGLPWSVPFEFPVYQWLVALASGLLGTNLDATGRVVSYGFLFACVFPVRAITRRLALSPLVFPLFCVFLFASPNSVYWGRTFMIETAALFFTVAAIRHFVDLLLDRGHRWSTVLFVVFATLGMLQKITTTLPVLMVLFGVMAAVRLSTPRPARASLAALIVEAAMCFGIPLAIGLGWTAYTDHVKQLNVFGEQLTSAALRWWTFGTLDQRLTKPLYRDVVQERIFERNLGGAFGLLLIVTALVLRWSGRAAWTLRIALLLGVLPMLIFTNLHLVHDYYTTGNLVFFLFALAVALGELVVRHVRSLPILLAAIAIVVVDDVRAFKWKYLPSVRAVYTDADDTEMALSTVLRAQVPVDRVFVAFDFDWTSSLAYLSERKAFMVSPLFTQAEAVRVDPARFVDPASLAAVVACPKDERRLRQLTDWSTRDRAWKIGLVDDCYVAVPETVAPVVPLSPTAPSTDRCDATAIAVLPVRESAAMRVVRLRLPRAVAGSPPVSYLTGTSTATMREMLDVTRRSPRPGIDHGDAPDLEFTRLVDVGGGHVDDAALRVWRRTGDRIDACRVGGAAGAP